MDFIIDISDFLDEPTCPDHMARWKGAEMIAADTMEREIELVTLDEAMGVLA